MTVVGETQIYRDLMRFKPEGLSANAWAVKAGVSRTVWADMRRHGNPSRRTLEKLLAAAGSSLLEFEALRLGPEPRPPMRELGGQLGDMRRPWSTAPLPPLPLIASALGGEWGDAASQVELTEIRPHEVLERLPRPPSLTADPDAYGVTIVGASMWPRFRTGSRVAVSPRLPVAVGDDVVACLRRAEGTAKDGVERVLIMHLVKRTTDMFELRQFNPDRIIKVAAADIETIFKIVGELI